MRKGSLFGVCVLVVIMAFSLSGRAQAETIKIGINAELTGDIPKVGEGTKFAAQMWLDDVKAAGGLAVGKKKYTVELVLEDNESKAESAVKVATKMITEDGVLVMVGPQASKQAIPAGGIANNYKTVMISPWSTNPDTTKDRPYVFRACFLDPFQGPVVANFISNEFKFTKAAVLYDVASDYPKGLAEFFKKAWEGKHGKGSVVAYESFTTKDTDFSSQLTKIINSGAQVLFTPQYYNEVALIVQQAHQLGWKKPIVGSDSWGSAETVKLCGKDCYGAFFSTHYAAAGATGATKAFIDRYKSKIRLRARRCGRAHMGLHAARSTGDPEHRRAHGRPEKGPGKYTHRDVPDQEIQRHHGRDDLHRWRRPGQVRGHRQDRRRGRVHVL